MITTNDKCIAKKLSKLRTHGIIRADAGKSAIKLNCGTTIRTNLAIIMGCLRSRLLLVWSS